jgi:DMSO/TMAO reductase YedYZ molybdopterin-dependent catalytic subunit
VAHLTRRAFLKGVAATLAAALAASCAPGRPADTHASTPLPTKEDGEMLRNENSPAIRPDWNVRFYRPFQALDPEAWRLTVDGLVGAPRAFTLSELHALPTVEQVSRLVCVEGWSAKAGWAGFTYQALADAMRPAPEATWLYFECGDGYYEYLKVAELQEPRVLFAYAMDGEPLRPAFGAPLRLLVPSRYGYKGPKTITHIRFQDSGGAGYWPSVGPHSTDGIIRPGIDHPLDLGGRRELKGGEVTEY